jgi:hypothetical protein
MADFQNIGGVGIMGYISPMNTEDTYPVIDPLYGIDGLRNVNTIDDMVNIPFERRRAGMIVGVDEEDVYYKLKKIDWTGEITDWSELSIVTLEDKVSFSDREEPFGIADGVNKNFILEFLPKVNSEHVYLNGLLQESGYDYTMDHNMIVFDEAPLEGMRIRCSYRY